jgi:hypothetical protein
MATKQQLEDELDQVPAEIAALKSGLGPFYGRILAALERIARALEGKS